MQADVAVLGTGRANAAPSRNDTLTGLIANDAEVSRGNTPVALLLLQLDEAGRPEGWMLEAPSVRKSQL